jgi:hypothetical protein
MRFEPAVEAHAGFVRRNGLGFHRGHSGIARLFG